MSKASPGRVASPRRPLPKSRAPEILKVLRTTYPDAHCELNHDGPFQLLIATILSAQCTDVRVNMVTPALFKKYPERRNVLPPPNKKTSKTSSAPPASSATKPKTSSPPRKPSSAIITAKSPEISTTLTNLPGVGRKTANVVLGNAYGIESGIVVDTHVARLSQRLGLTKQKDPVKIEKDLIKQIPQDTLDPLEPPPHLARPPPLHGPQPRLPPLRTPKSLPLRQQIQHPQKILRVTSPIQNE